MTELTFVPTTLSKAAKNTDTDTVRDDEDPYGALHEDGVGPYEDGVDSYEDGADPYEDEAGAVLSLVFVFVLSCLVLSCLVLSCLVLSCLVLSCLVVLYLLSTNLFAFELTLVFALP